MTASEVRRKGRTIKLVAERNTRIRAQPDGQERYVDLRTMANTGSHWSVLSRL